jgi:hypothetical protein
LAKSAGNGRALPIENCRLMIKKWCGESFQRPSAIGNRQSKVGNSRQGTKATGCEEKTLALCDD